MLIATNRLAKGHGVAVMETAWSSSQSQCPLALVVAGGMIMILIFVNLVGILFSFYGKNSPDGSQTGGLAH